ncbi:Multiple epidermal growth factor-like domains protein 9 [Triplophysa tibetana]|uniref:Multiple epidermal growth factor-like domains protein 9 n=1 Tax=Triplophysa tibetana TaxID=1572043 RepID=A0A5A9P7D7_9TELE|nr:Multiple epidermal growth factor-like domains protein 9 [Triplophysa tibetana]
MMFMRYSMLLFSVLELLLFGCTAGLSRAAQHQSDESESLGARLPRAVPGEPLETTTIPNHLQEDDRGFRLPPFTPKMTSTTRESRTTGKSNQLEPLWVTTTAAPLTKTTNPTFKRTEVKPTFFSKLNITVNSTFSTSISYTTKTLPEQEGSSSSWTAKSTTNPLLTTEKGPQCNCSAEGSVNPDTCDLVTGQCECLPEYTGHQCDRCKDEYFTNGTSGCQACGCDYGAANKLCNSSGVCTCKAGVHGDKCDNCRPGFTKFNSTGCQPCQCSNHSNVCNPLSGLCVNCQGNTEGSGCEKCRNNFYRKPRTPVTDACIPCPCSSVTSTGNCTLDKSGQPICNQCNPEYQGRNCEQCSDGFYNADSICLPCNCTGNADPHTSPRICHPETGQCLKCINNTTGLHCERCADGFTGDALAKNCTPTVVHTSPSTTTLGFQYTTMTSSPNATTQFSMSTLVTRLGTSAPNTTKAAVTLLPWNQFNIIILAVIIIVVVALMAAVGGVYTYREYQNRKLNAPFWTIELKEDNISFGSYHDSIPNADISGLLEEEVNEISNGQLALSVPSSLYKI